MTTQLAPTPIFKAFDNAGLPLSFGFLYTYQAGTNTPQPTYTDSTGNTPNPNPVLLNARGEAQIWLNPLQNYKFLLTDSLGNQIPGWPVDNISGSLYPGQSIIPNTDNAFDIGSLSDRWRNGYFGTQIFVGPNNSPIVDSSGNVGYWARTAAEISAGVTPVNFAYAPNSVRRYGAGLNGTGDGADNAALTSAIAVAKHSGQLIIDYPIYVASTGSASALDFNGCNGVNVIQTALIYGPAAAALDSIVCLRNCTDINWNGLWVSGQYNQNTACAVAFYTDNASQSSNITITLHSIVGALVAFRAARSTDVGTLVSEITVDGGFTYGCPNVCFAYGTQTVITFNGSNLLANSLGGNAGWQALTQYTIRAFGAIVIVNGGEVQHNQTTTTACLCIEPITDGTYGNNWGSVIVVGAELETAAPMAIAQNSLGVVSPIAGTGLISIDDCEGYTGGNTFAMVQSAAGFTGKIVIPDGNHFYAGAARTFANVTAADNCDIYVGDSAFGTNYLQGLQGITGGIAHFTHRQICVVSQTNGQALANGVATTLVWSAFGATNDTTHFQGDYATGTGLFTVPAGGLKSVEISVAARIAAGASTLELDVYLNGAFFLSFPMSMGGAGNIGVVSGTLAVGDLVQGTTIAIKATAGSATTENYGATGGMRIYARN